MTNSSKPSSQGNLAAGLNLTGQPFDPSKPVKVYRNLHKECYSVQQGGRVVAHAYEVCLERVQFIVQPAGNAKVRKEQKKNVHAFVKGTLAPDVWIRQPRRAMYNPYQHETFVDGMTWKPVFFAGKALLNTIGVLYDKEES